ncbi:hypothetical protein JTB14_009727 [Gonioctena quinquepunctata]|nr:hypothetical protein JTB14_009727 [Gonioctena quinquepunctata]
MLEGADHCDCWGRDRKFADSALSGVLLLDIFCKRSAISFGLMLSFLSGGGTAEPSLRCRFYPFLLEWVKFVSSGVSLHLCNLAESRELIIWSANCGSRVASKSLLI